MSNMVVLQADAKCLSILKPRDGGTRVREVVSQYNTFRLILLIQVSPADRLKCQH